MSLSTLDLALIGIYFLVVLIVGLLSSRNETKEGYLIADRSLDTLSSAMTISASKIGAGLLLTYTALIYQYGLGALWLFIGYIFGYIVFYFFAKRVKKLSDQKSYYTLPDFYFDKYGKTAGYLVALIVTTTMFGWVVINFIGGAKIVNNFTNISFEASSIIIGVIILFYLIVGGFKAVVKTDKVQFIGIFLLLFLMAYLLITKSSSLQASDFNLFSIPTGQIITFFIAGLFFPMASAELWQRVYAIKDEKTLKNSIIFASIFYVIIGIVLLFIGLIIKNTLTDIDPDNALVAGFSALLPAGLAGLGVIVFYSAVMSTADTYLFTSNASLVQDIIGKSKTYSKETLLKIMKLTMTALMILAVVLAITLRDVVDTTFLIGAMMMSLGLITIIIWIYPKLNRISINFALILSTIAVIIFTLKEGISTNLVTYSLESALAGIFLGVTVNGIIIMRKKKYQG